MTLNLEKNDKLKPLTTFLGKSSIEQIQKPYTYEDQYAFDEVLQLDEHGGVFKITSRPYKSDTFSYEQYQDMLETI